MIRFDEVEKLSHSQAGMASAYRAGQPLLDAGWMRYAACCWDKRAMLAFDGDACVGGLNWTEEHDELDLRIDFAWCDPRYPQILAALLARFRAKYRDSRFLQIRFTCHEGNEAMAKAVRILGLKPASHSYRMPVSRLGGRR